MRSAERGCAELVYSVGECPELPQRPLCGASRYEARQHAPGRQQRAENSRLWDRSATGKRHEHTVFSRSVHVTEKKMLLWTEDACV